MSVQWGRGEGPQENKFEQVYSDHHQMSVAWVPPGLMWGQGCTLPCDLTHGAFDVRSIYQPTTKNSPHPNPHPEQTQACENSTFNKFRLGYGLNCSVRGRVSSSRNWTQQTVKVVFFGKAPCASPPGLISNRPMWEGGGSSALLAPRTSKCHPKEGEWEIQACKENAVCLSTGVCLQGQDPPKPEMLTCSYFFGDILPDFSP